MYVLVRSDLSPGLQIAQACHAVAEFSLEHPAEFHEWAEEGRNIVVLDGGDKAEFERWLTVTNRRPLCAWWAEPDVGNEITAIAALGSQWTPTFANLPLAGRQAVPA